MFIIIQSKAEKERSTLNEEFDLITLMSKKVSVDFLMFIL